MFVATRGFISGTERLIVVEGFGAAVTPVTSYGYPTGSWIINTAKAWVNQSRTQSWIDYTATAWVNQSLESWITNNAAVPGPTPGQRAFF